MAVSMRLKFRRKRICQSYAINLFFMSQGESLNHIFFFECLYSLSCWFLLFDVFTFPWVFSNSWKANVLQL